MRFFIGTLEICGWISLYAKELRKAGHEVTTFTYEKNRFFEENEYDYVFTDYQVNIRSRFSIINRIVFKLNWIVRSVFLFFFKKKISKNSDVIIYIWNSLQYSHQDIAFFKNRGKKLIFFFVGSDVRHFNTFKNQYDVSNWDFPKSWAEVTPDRYLRYIRNAEKYGDLIYSVPDQAGLQTRPYYHPQIPIEIDKIKFTNNKRKIPKVLHLPSDPWKKGTDIIERVIEELKSEGVKFDFVTLRDVSNKETLILLQDIDIVVDEIVFHGPGVLAFEAMASGCAVATRYLSDSPACFRPPVVNIDASNIKEKLRILFLDYELQQDLIVSGRKYVEANNDSSIVVKGILSKLSVKTVCDYTPLNK